MIIITAKHDGFRRCGIAHSATPTEYPNDRFTEEELAILQQEPMLVVTRGADPEAGKAGGKGKGKAAAKDNQQPAVGTESEGAGSGSTEKTPDGSPEGAA